MTSPTPSPISDQAAGEPFQQRVQPWMLVCFGEEIAADRIERNHRFFEEATELVQALGMTASEAHQLVDYTFSRPVGEPSQEVGGSMVTLAALCLANGIDMHLCGEQELDRINNPFTIEKIRAKQASKPKHSPLPEHVAPEAALTAADELVWQQWLFFKKDACPPSDDRFFESFRKAGLALLAAIPADKPVVTVRVTHEGYAMVLSTYIAYALPEGKHDLYAKPQATAKASCVLTDEQVRTIEEASTKLENIGHIFAGDKQSRRLAKELSAIVAVIGGDLR